MTCKCSAAQLVSTGDTLLRKAKMSRVKVQEPGYHNDQKNHRRQPPKPTHSSRSDFVFVLSAKLLFDELVIIEFVIGQPEPLRVGFVGPPRLFIGPAFGRSEEHTSELQSR